MIFIDLSLLKINKTYYQIKVGQKRKSYQLNITHLALISKTKANLINS